MFRSRHHQLIFALWAVCAIVPVAGLMAKHVAPFARRGQADFPVDTRWRIRHLLVAGCACSSIVAQALAGRAPIPGIDERAVIAGPDAAIEGPLRRAGWTVDVLPPEQMRDRYQVPGGPWLLVADPSGRERYAGGYAQYRPTRVSDVDDRRLIAAAMQGEAIASRPAFGCIASAALKAN